MFENDSGRHRKSVLPRSVFEGEPGPELAAFLSVVDAKELSGHDQILVLRAHQRMASHYQAKFYSDVAALTDVMVEFDQDMELATHAAAMELRAALRLTRRMAEMEIDFAQELVHRLPQVAEALEAGRIDVRRAKVLVNGTIHVTEAQARQVVDELLDRAGQLTTGELRAKVAKLCLSVEPEEARQRYALALDERRLVKQPTLAGTANIMLTDIAPDKAAMAFDRINTLAKSLHISGEPRTMDQLRADIALDLLSGSPTHQNAKGGTVNIHVDLETLARLTDDPGELAGFGPVVADIARQVAEDHQNAEWRFRVTDPATGQPIHMGATRQRRHTADQRRRVELRDLVCATPGCRMPAVECDIDHIKPWAETGRTSVEDSAPGCRHDHVGRHMFGWTYRPIPGGDYLWTSRLGHTYTTSGRPPPPTE